MAKVIDLFSGVGGLSQGFVQAGFEVVLANEFDHEIGTSYANNHPGTDVVISDIRELLEGPKLNNFSNQIDVVIGGPPCQGFSQKGQRKSINDDRNFLFKYYVEVVKRVRPKYFLMENVPNLLTAENGYFKQELTALFKKLGYRIQAGTLNSADFGVPQKRKRAFVIGKLGEEPVDLPISNNERVSVWEAISDLNFLASGEGNEIGNYLISPQSQYQQRLRKGADFLYNHKATKHSEVALERLKLMPQNVGVKTLPLRHRTKSIYSGTWTRLVKEEFSATITTRFDTPSSGQFTHPMLDRAITVREAARLQSFPDTFRFHGTKTAQMKQVGNAVPPKLAEEIAKVIIRDL